MAYIIKCPICGYAMGVTATDTTRSSGGQIYDWTKYWCKRDDVAIQLETPQATEEET